jgi:hypothetical protein
MLAAVRLATYGHGQRARLLTAERVTFSDDPKWSYLRLSSYIWSDIFTLQDSFFSFPLLRDPFLFFMYHTCASFCPRGFM